MGVPDFRIARGRIAGKTPCDVAWLAIERIYNELATPYRHDERLDALTNGQRAAYVLHWVQPEVRNGGFEQLYLNSAGRFAPEAPEAASAIGASGYAELFRRANALFPNSVVPLGRGERAKALADVMANHVNDLESIETDFFNLIDRNDICEQIGRFILQRPVDFFVD